MKPALTLEDIRRAIDSSDTILLKALAARFRAVACMKKLKKEQGIPTEDPARETDLKASWKAQAAELGLSQELALLMLDFILAESKGFQDSDEDL